MAPDIALALALLNLALLAALAVFVRSLVLDAVEELDERLALALKSVLDTLPIGDYEPPNPLQQMLMGVIQQNMAKSPLNPGGEALKSQIIESKSDD